MREGQTFKFSQGRMVPVDGVGRSDAMMPMVSDADVMRSLQNLATEHPDMVRSILGKCGLLGGGMAGPMGQEKAIPRGCYQDSCGNWSVKSGRTNFRIGDPRVACYKKYIGFQGAIALPAAGGTVVTVTLKPQVPLFVGRRLIVTLVGDDGTVFLDERYITLARLQIATNEQQSSNINNVTGLTGATNGVGGQAFSQNSLSNEVDLDGAESDTAITFELRSLPHNGGAITGNLSVALFGDTFERA